MGYHVNNQIDGKIEYTIPEIGTFTLVKCDEDIIKQLKIDGLWDQMEHARKQGYDAVAVASSDGKGRVFRYCSRKGDDGFVMLSGPDTPVAWMYMEFEIIFSALHQVPIGPGGIP